MLFTCVAVLVFVHLLILMLRIGEFKKAGKTSIILEDSNGDKQIYEIDIKNNSYDINKK